MPRQRSRKLSEGHKAVQKPNSPAKDEREHDDIDIESTAAMEKDEDELELDKLVLGNGAGLIMEPDREEEEYQDEASELGLEADLGLKDEERNLENVDDADVRKLPLSTTNLQLTIKIAFLPR